MAGENSSCMAMCLIKIMWFIGFVRVYTRTNEAITSRSKPQSALPSSQATWRWVCLTLARWFILVVETQISVVRLGKSKRKWKCKKGHTCTTASTDTQTRILFDARLLLCFVQQILILFLYLMVNRKYSNVNWFNKMFPMDFWGHSIQYHIYSEVWPGESSVASKLDPRIYSLDSK